MSKKKNGRPFSLTKEQLTEIAAHFAEDVLTQRYIASQYNVTQPRISQLKKLYNDGTDLTALTD